MSRASCLWILWELYGVCGQIAEQSASPPPPCLCANAVLKWAHYHQREHKHSSRKQDSLCQEREPLPEAYCRPDDITRLKITTAGMHPKHPQQKTSQHFFFFYCSLNFSKSSKGSQGFCYRCSVQRFSICSIFHQSSLLKIHLQTFC